MKPKFDLHSIVGFDGKLWCIAGINTHLGYNFNGFEYSLMGLNWQRNGENTEKYNKWVPEDKILSKTQMEEYLQREKEKKIAELEAQINLLRG